MWRNTGDRVDTGPRFRHGGTINIEGVNDNYGTIGNRNKCVH